MHEKTILLPLLPLLIVAAAGRRSLFFFAWLSAVAVFSMYPLLVKDGLALPYATLQLVYAAFAFGRAHAPSRRWALACAASLLGCAALHAAAVWVPPPPRYPDLHLLACAAYAFAHFAAACVALNVLVWRLPALDADGQPVLGGSDVATTAAMERNEDGPISAAAAVTTLNGTSSVVLGGNSETDANQSKAADTPATMAAKASPRRLRQRRPTTSGSGHNSE